MESKVYRVVWVKVALTTPLCVNNSYGVKGLSRILIRRIALFRQRVNNSYGVKGLSRVVIYCSLKTYNSEQLLWSQRFIA